MDGLLLIKFCSFFSSFRMVLTNSGWAHGRSSLLSIFRKLSTLSGTSFFSANSFHLVSLLASLVGLNLSFLIGMLARFIKITKVAPFESVKVFRNDPFLVLYFSFFSSMISLLILLLPYAALFMLTIRPCGPPPGDPYCARGHTRSFFSTGALV